MSEEVQRVEVITAVQRGRRWSVAEKIRFVEETLQPGMSVSFATRRHGFSPSLLFNWRRRMAEGGREAVRVDDDVIGAARMSQLEERIREFERLPGRLCLQKFLFPVMLALPSIAPPAAARRFFSDEPPWKGREAFAAELAA